MYRCGLCQLKKKGNPIRLKTHKDYDIGVCKKCEGIIALWELLKKGVFK